MNIHQFVHTLQYGDAISGEALAIRRILRSQKINSEIYCVNVHEKLKSIGRPYQEFIEDTSEQSSSDKKTAVILHYSIASPLNKLLIEAETISTRVLIYHNLTPVRWFSRYNYRVAQDLVVAHKELPELLPRVNITLADSEFNCRELESFGCSGAEKLPLVFDEQLWSEPANSGIVQVLRSHGGKNLLHVGRIAPNKKIEDIIKAFYFYHHKINHDSRLWLIGTDIDTEIYSFELRRLVSELQLSKAVMFVGSVSTGELRAFYENADVYLCMSEHEGFCMPLLEAMYFGVPVIAYSSTAVPETLGTTGILISEKSPAKIAELIEIIINDKNSRERIIKEQKTRVEEFNEKRFFSDLKTKLISKLEKEQGEIQATQGKLRAHG